MSDFSQVRKVPLQLHGSFCPAVWTNVIRFEGQHSFNSHGMPLMECQGLKALLVICFSFINALHLDLGVHSPSCSIRKVGGPSSSLNKDPHVITAGCDSWWSLWCFLQSGHNDVTAQSLWLLKAKDIRASECLLYAKPFPGEMQHTSTHANRSL